LVLTMYPALHSVYRLHVWQQLRQQIAQK